MIAQTHGRPRVSVILPMGDHRGLWREAIESWTTAQQCSAEDYELIVVLDHTVRHLEQSCRSILRAQDQLLHANGVELKQYHAGATRARGDILFFSEPHCLAQTDTVAEIIRFMDTHPVDGLCARTVPVCVNAMGQAESRMFDAGFREWSTPEHWVKVIIRGFGIRKSAYESVGGFEYELDRFAEWLMAARLRSRGYELAYAPSVAVQHRYGDYFGLFDKDIKEFTDGECRFRLESGETQLVRAYFGEPPEWAHALSVRNAPTWQTVRPLALRARGRGAIPTPLGNGACIEELLKWRLARLLAKRALVPRYQARVLFWKLAFWLSLTEGQRALAFQSYYMAATEYCRVRFALRDRAAERQHTVRADYPVSELDEQDLWGFSNVESHQAASFRWARPFACIRVRLSPETRSGSLQLAAVRPVDPATDLALFLDDVPLEITHLDADAWTLHFTIPPNAVDPDRDQWLSIHTARWRHPEVLRTDRRVLGLPIRALQFGVPASFPRASQNGASRSDRASTLSTAVAPELHGTAVLSRGS
jgi:hypothetical protein